MDSRGRKRLITEASDNESKPLSAWERRKLYSKQMYDKHRTSRNLENKTSILASSSGNQLQNPSNNARANLKVVESNSSLAKKVNIAKEDKQVVKRHKAVTGKDSLFAKKKISPKRKWQSSSDGKENSEPKRSNSNFPVRRTSPRQHSVDVSVDKGSSPEQPSVPKLRRSASFTIDKETGSIAGNISQNMISETQDVSFHKNDIDIKPAQSVEGVSPPKTSLSQNNQGMPECSSTADNAKKDKKAHLLKRTPLKPGKKVSLQEKKDKFVKPENSSGIKLTRREKLMAWKQQNSNCISTNNRRMTSGPAVFGSITQPSMKPVEVIAKQTRERRTLSSADILREKRISRASKSSFTVISSKLHEPRNSNRLSIIQKKNESSHIIPTDRKLSLQSSRKLRSSNILPRCSVAANLARTLASRKTPIKPYDHRKSTLENKGTGKTNKFGTKRKSVSSHDSKMKDAVSEQCGNPTVINSETDVTEQLEYGTVVEMENTFGEEKESMVEEPVREKLENDAAINHTPFDKGMASSRKKSVCFDVPLHGSTPGKTLPKTPKRDFTLRERLQLWLDNKGHSVSSFRHVKCFGYHLSSMKPKKNLRQSRDKIDATPVPETTTLTLGESPVLRTRSSSEKKLDSSVSESFDVNEVLAELKVLLANGHPIKDITEWLDELVKYLPVVEENPQYWICRSLVAELQNGLNGAIAVYHAALNKKLHGNQEENENQIYTAEICKALDGLLRRYTENFNKNTVQQKTPHKREKQNEHVHLDTPRELLIDKKNIFNSTVIKYDVLYNTPGSYRSSVKAVVTPVRRSARLSCTPMPKNSKPGTLVESLADLPENIKEEVLFRENTALILD